MITRFSEIERFLRYGTSAATATMFFAAALGDLCADGPARVVVNKTVPKVEPPQASLVFSASPTVQEIFRARVFEEPLVPIGGEPGADENAALAAALLGYANRTGPDDFSSVTGFLERHPRSPWRAALLTGLGFEYYNTAHYSLALEAWSKAWTFSNNATDSKGIAVADRAGGELAYMYARLGRMTELDALLKSVEGRVFVGPATEKIAGAREGLWNMQNRPEISFRCGPLALHRIKRLSGAQSEADMVIFNSASTQKGLSLPQVAELSKKVGLNYQMAFREQRGGFVIPSVVHWKVGHYAAMVRQEGERFLLEDPTFGNTVWATREALEAETSGYFLIPPGPLPKGWRAVESKEGREVWGKGFCTNNDDKQLAPDDPQTPNACKRSQIFDALSGIMAKYDATAKYALGSFRMAVPGVHLMLVSLNIVDAPVGYAPPVGPAVEFTVRYNHREAYQPGTFTYSNFGPKWTCDWISYITDNPQSALADVNYYVRGGGTRTFTSFNTNTQTYGYQQYDQTLLKRVAPASYELHGRDGSKMIFSQSDGSIDTSRKVFLTQVVDPFGNTVTLNYDSSLRLTNITDAIGQVTTLSYSNAAYANAITRVTDPFGRFASFDYDASGRLTNITDVIGITSRFTYEGSGDFINSLITPYGTNVFTRGGSGTTRWLETLYPDGSKDRVEFNQSSGLGVPFSDPANTVPQGMSTYDNWLYARTTYYWSRTACAQGYGDYSKAKIYHWLHNPDLTTTSGMLESTKEALEGRVWYDYDGQSAPYYVGSTDRPKHVGRVLDDGSTQLYTYGYNTFGNVTNTIDPLGRTFSYLYATNGIDLLEVRMTRAGQHQLLYQATYNAQHLPLITAGADGQTTTNTYNARGQLLTKRNPKAETTTYTYNTNCYLIAVDGPLAGTNDTSTATYDGFGRTQTKTDASGYMVTFAYDALDRLTNTTFPDATFDAVVFDRLDAVLVRDRGGRQTLLEYTPLGQLAKRTDPLGRVTQFQWCDCGSIKTLTDPMGRTTGWETDVQGRLIAKQYGDGSKVSYFYEYASGRLRQVVDEKSQVKRFVYNRDNTLRSISYQNTISPPPPVNYTYDPDYKRITSMTDGIGTNFYSYHSITMTPTVGAGQLANIDGPHANDTIAYEYDELGRPVTTAIGGVGATVTHDAVGRIISETNALGSFSYIFDGSSRRILSQTFPNGMTRTNSYGNNSQDLALARITHRTGATPISEFIYGRNISAGRITTWSQQSGAAVPDIYTFGYDDADRLLSVAVTNAGAPVKMFAYAYDLADNRLLEVADGATNTATHNALNQISTTTAVGSSHTNEWDAKNRLVAVNAGSERTEFTYDGMGMLVSIRRLTNGIDASFRRLLWCDNQIREERDASGNVTKRYYSQGMKIVSGTNTGDFFFTRDHLLSIREVTDSGGSVRARYSYDPYGRQTLVSGDVGSDFGFTGIFWCSESGLSLSRFRAYDATLGRWLSRDPLRKAEQLEGPNLYAYVRNNPVNAVDPLGLCCIKEQQNYQLAQVPGLAPGLSPECQFWKSADYAACNGPLGRMDPHCQNALANTLVHCELPLRQRWLDCMSKPCSAPPCQNVGVGGGSFGGGFPNVGAGIGSEQFVDYNVVESEAAGKPAERQAAGTSVSAPIEED